MIQLPGEMDWLSTDMDSLESMLIWMRERPHIVERRGG